MLTLTVCSHAEALDWLNKKLVLMGYCTYLGEVPSLFGWLLGFEPRLAFWVKIQALRWGLRVWQPYLNDTANSSTNLWIANLTVADNVFGKKCDGAHMFMLDSARPSDICYDRLQLHSDVLHFLLRTHDCSVANNDLQLDHRISFNKSSLWQYVILTVSTQIFLHFLFR